MCFLEVQNRSMSNTLGLCSLDIERLSALKTPAMAYKFMVNIERTPQMKSTMSE